MSWKERVTLDLRTEFVLKSLSKDIVFRDLCKEYGISAKTGYKWQRRFTLDGISGLHDKPRRPHSNPDCLPEDTVCEMINLKNAHLNWGPNKIREIYRRKHIEVPSLSSFKRVFDKAGLVKKRRIRNASDPNQRITTDIEAELPNDVWTVDFKGWWKVQDGRRCDPLTVRDLKTKYLLSLQAMESCRSENIKIAFQRIFEKYGLPKVILTDNGPPFALSHSLLGLTALSVWWIVLGIRLHRIKPASPQENGSHERMHKDIKCELQNKINGDLTEHQARFDVWRHEYNWVRPHEALAMRTPADVYKASSRKWNGTPEQIEYGNGYDVRKVNTVGVIVIDQQRFQISSALRGWNVGLKYITSNVIDVYFDYLRLGEINLNTNKFTPVSKFTK